MGDAGMSSRSTGPGAHWFSGHLRAFRTAPPEFLRMCRREYGDIVPLRFAATPVLLLNHPRLVEQVLLATENRFVAHNRSVRELIHVLGDGLFTSAGAYWRRQRRLMQPAFHHEAVAAFGAIMTAEAERAVAGGPYVNCYAPRR
jgi:cytochrome P450